MANGNEELLAKLEGWREERISERDQRQESARKAARDLAKLATYCSEHIGDPDFLLFVDLDMYIGCEFRRVKEQERKMSAVASEIEALDAAIRAVKGEA